MNTPDDFSKDFEQTAKDFRAVMHPMFSQTVSDALIAEIWAAHSERYCAQWLISDTLTPDYVRGMIHGWLAAAHADASKWRWSVK